MLAKVNLTKKIDARKEAKIRQQQALEHDKWMKEFYDQKRVIADREQEITTEALEVQLKRRSSSVAAPPTGGLAAGSHAPTTQLATGTNATPSKAADTSKDINLQPSPSLVTLQRSQQVSSDAFVLVKPSVASDLKLLETDVTANERAKLDIEELLHDKQHFMQQQSELQIRLDGLSVATSRQ